MYKLEKNDLLFDLECSPMLVSTWGMFEQNANWVHLYSYVLSAAYQWGDEADVKVKTIRDFPLYKKDQHDDRELVKHIHSLFTKAKRIIAHNGKAFDIKFMNARFRKHKLSPVKRQVIDTCREDKAFGTPSHSQKTVLDYYGLGKKGDGGGIDTWIQCRDGKPNDRKTIKAFKELSDYNKTDIVGLRSMALDILPWITNLPVGDNRPPCPRCGSLSSRSKGKEHLSTGWKKSFQCKLCGYRFTDSTINKYEENTDRPTTKKRERTVR